ncbi:glycine--tRNA ligase subunit beta [Gloeobacter violaceus]|uniref:Glycine--tRNA ligase beta subunit n=1 Tax=Gloeobacter violaceus (strain ATCC 29082 / PCC 7421) TaxID=251221 RepID=Q7NK34_GLOVI|nr:glycine--tRNA ligase subunit beta [Gloeobacter violaceus]BAC89587.1 glycyl-tRNA synthetase beta chain [Gloeobacter violaceus PCC 7421]
MATFLLEIGTEELPASFVPGALAQLEARVRSALAEAQITAETLKLFGTPRRLAVLAEGLPERQPDREEELKGPPARVAFDAGGRPTAQAEGFARKAGVAVGELSVRATEKGEVVFAVRRIEGRPVTQLLAEQIPEWITGLEGPRLMRWADGDLRFSRPIRWLVALVDSEVLPVEMAGVSAGRTSRGHRVLHPEPIELATAADYPAALTAAFVLADPEVRRERIRTGIAAVAEQLGAEAAVPAALLEEVNFLVEWPTAVAGQFESEFLSLPAPVIKTEMITHQRYFPLHQPGDPEALIPRFITVSNGDPRYSELIARGNGRVIRARLADGRFFFEEDRKQPLEKFLGKLQSVTFQESLGSVAERVERLEAIALWLCGHLGLGGEQTRLVARTAHLCKADLATQMVYEFPELQGLVGRDYARLDGEEPLVCAGIAEHYQPRNVEDDLPASLTGQVVGIADRLETLVGIFGLGMLPSGSSDPFALRRAALTVVRIGWDTDFELDLVEALGFTVELFVSRQLLKQPADTLLEQLCDWFAQRLYGLLVERDGLDYDLVLAVLGAVDTGYTRRALANLRALKLRLDTLVAARKSGLLAQIYETAVRVARLAGKAGIGDLTLEHFDAQLVADPAEAALREAVQKFAATAEAAEAQEDYPALLGALGELAPQVSCFFDAVMVMVPDETLRTNRLRLLAVIDNNARRCFDVTQVVMAGGQSDNDPIHPKVRHG